MNKISRKGFLKIAAAAAMSGVTAGALAACNAASSSTAASSGAAGSYTPGTYTGTAEGISSTVKVTMTFSDSAVTDVVVDTSGETASYGAAAAEELKNQLLNAGSDEIDGVSGSTITSDAVKKAAKSCFAQAKGEASVTSVQLPTGDETDWLGKEPDIDEAAITETVDTDILVIGAGDGGVVRELTRYDRVERIDLVEMDPQVVEACRAFLPSNACRMDDRRVHIYFENALKYIRRCEEEYDLIIVDSSDPFGPSEGLFTREFYGSCFNALKEDGIMVNQQGSPFYAEDANAMQRSHKRIASTFPISRVYQAHIPTFAAGYWLFGFASKKYHPIDDLDAAAWKALNMRTRYYTTKLHIGAFYLPAFLEEMLREVEEH